MGLSVEIARAHLLHKLSLGHRTPEEDADDVDGSQLARGHLLLAQRAAQRERLPEGAWCAVDRVRKVRLEFGFVKKRSGFVQKVQLRTRSLTREEKECTRLLPVAVNAVCADSAQRAPLGTANVIRANQSIFKQKQQNHST